MEIDKLAVLETNLKMMLRYAENKLNENNATLEEKAGENDGEDEVTEEVVSLGMYGTYLLGVCKTLDMVLQLLEGDTLDEIAEKIKEMKDGIAKA